MITRHYDAEYINEVCNHPSVFDHVRMRPTRRIDLSAVAANPCNYLLMTLGGGCAFQKLAPGVYEGHYQFLPHARGRLALNAMREAADYMFGRTDCHTIVGRTPAYNRAALAMNRALGFEFVTEHKDAWDGAHGVIALREYRLTRQQWLSMRNANAC